MAHWLLTYDLAPDYLERRPAFRDLHLEREPDRIQVLMARAAHRLRAVLREALPRGGARRGVDVVEDDERVLAAELHRRAHEASGGALGDPTDQAMLLFAGSDASAAEAFARADPYVTNGLVVGWRVRPWLTVAGADAATPVRP